jgi:hypothetical protein
MSGRSIYFTVYSLLGTHKGLGAARVILQSSAPLPAPLQHEENAVRLLLSALACFAVYPVSAPAAAVPLADRSAVLAVAQAQICSSCSSETSFLLLISALPRFPARAQLRMQHQLVIEQPHCCDSVVLRKRPIKVGWGRGVLAGRPITTCARLTSPSAAGGRPWPWTRCW